MRERERERERKKESMNVFFIERGETNIGKEPLYKIQSNQHW